MDKYIRNAKQNFLRRQFLVANKLVHIKFVTGFARGSVKDNYKRNIWAHVRCSVVSGVPTQDN